MSETQGYHFYWNGPFSQWQISQFTLWGIDFNTAEQAMMVGKARLFGDESTAAEIMAAEDPGKQKALGRKVHGFDEDVWDANKVGLVKQINFAKFDQNKGLRRKLFQTIPMLMVEASPMDTIWGIGLDEANARQTPTENWPGQNLLGRIVTEVRNELAVKFPEEAKACAPTMGEEH